MRNIFKKLSLVLVTTIASTFLFTGTVHASPLLEYDATIEQSRKIVQEKFDEIDAIDEQTLTIEQRKDKLAVEVKELRVLVGNLNKQIEAKKEAEKLRIEAEKKRVAEEKRLAAEKAKRIAAAKVAPTYYSSDGNTYGYGYCTYYAKSRRPDLPNSLGNANTWYIRASALGLPTGTTPRTDAIGVSTRGYLGHVVYVESVNGSTITISEMNYEGWNVISTRTANAGEFVYVY